ncbi:MAG TPA: hypothetical protein EYP85_13560 [Armatimonadetes bacterium]|nr:hypothetical protein [Armatimonadota bacterium]
MLGLIGGLLVVAGGVWAAAPKVELKYQFRKGQTLRYRDWALIATLRVTPRGEDRVQIKSESIYEQEVSKVEDSVFELLTRTVSGRMTTIHNGDTKEEEVPSSRELVRLDARGQVLSRKDLEKEEGEESDLTAPVDNPFEILQRVYDNLLFPAQPVELGATWTDTAHIKLSAKHSVSVDIRSQLVRLVKVMGYDCAEIKTIFTVPLSEAPLEGKQVVPMTISGHLSGNLTLYFAYREGYDVAHVGEISYAMKMRAEPPPEAARLGAEPLEIATKMRVNLKTILQKE